MEIKDRFKACWYILTKKKFVVFAYNYDIAVGNGAVAVYNKISKAFGLAIAEVLGNEENYSKD